MDERPPTILFIGTNSQFSTYPLNQMIKKYPVMGIIESAPIVNRPGRLFYPFYILLDRWFNPHSLFHLAKRYQIPYFFYPKNKTEGVIQFIKSHPADTGVVASMNHLLPDEVLKILPFGFINIHPSLLPDLKGPLVWPWIYFYNDSQAGVTIHYLDSGEDSGAIIKQETFPVVCGMPAKKLIRQVIGLGTVLLMETLADLHNGKIESHNQPLTQTQRRARRLKSGENLFLFRHWSLEHTYHFLQGVKTWYSPFHLQSFSLGILDWKISGYSRQAPRPAKTGTIGLDFNGFFFSHPEGKVRLDLQVTIFRLFILLLLIFAGVNILLTH